MFPLKNLARKGLILQLCNNKVRYLLTQCVPQSDDTLPVQVRSTRGVS